MDIPSQPLPKEAAIGEFTPPPFQPRFPWISADLQTLRNNILMQRADLSQWPERRIWIDLNDGTGDELAAMIHTNPSHETKPLCVLIHGLTGCEDSYYLRRTACHFLGLGYPVLRLNLRGAGASRERCRGNYNAGRSADLAAALTALKIAKPELVENGLLLIGYSLGGNMLLKFLAEYGTDFPIRAAATVSAPIDLRATNTRFMRPRNRLYQWHMLRNLKQDVLTPPSDVTPEERELIQRTRSVYEFDEAFVAPRNGFASAYEYYDASSAARFMPAISLPTLLVHSLDDPIVAPEPYAHFPWNENSYLVPALHARGGHVGFHNRHNPIPWHDQVMTEFFATL